MSTLEERVSEVKTKSEEISETGYSRDEAKDYQQMAKHPEVVKQVVV